jgi:hypothetical protein
MPVLIKGAVISNFNVRSLIISQNTIINIEFDDKNLIMLV